MEFPPVLEQAESYAVDWRIAPSLIKEAACAVEMVEIVFVGLAAPEIHVCDFKVAPEMAGAVAIGLEVMFGPSLAVNNPVHGIVLVQVVVVAGEELYRFGPEGGDAIGGVVQVDGEAVRLVVVLHEAEDIVIDVTEEMDLGFDAPVVLHVLQGGMLVEHARVPTAHLVVAEHVGILDIVLLQYVGALDKQVLVDPAGHLPVLLWHNLVAHLGLGGGARGLFELFGKGNVVEEGPGVVELVVPSPFEILHGLEDAGQLFIADEREQGGVDAIRV